MAHRLQTISADTARSHRTKKGQLESLISRPWGALMSELERYLEWRAHSIRSDISELRKDGVVVFCARH